MTEPTSKRRKTENVDAPTITDARFTNIQSDPRYRLPGKKQKVRLDKRFSRALQDEDFSRKSKVDRYGRKLDTETEKQRLKRRYDFAEDESEELSDEADDDDEVQRELRRVGESRDVLREGKDVSSSDEDSSSEEEGDVSDEVDEKPGPGLQKPDVPLGEVSSRLAVVNLDWDNIRAEDLMAVFNSFVPPTGRLPNVAIYPSEFGKERMGREEMEGPPKEIFAGNNDDSMSGSEEDDQDIKDSLIKPDDGSEFDSAALRQYQLDRLRYFYAVLTFSSPGTAKAIYDSVDGTEYLSTANFFDLRFVPDDTDFSEDTPREECSKIPAGYKPNEFVTDALQHSKVKLTWDADDGGRKEAQARAFRGSRQDIDENDLKAYLGTDSESESDVEEAQIAVETMSSQTLSKKDAERQRMRALLGLTTEPVKKTKKGKDLPTGNIQITFSSGLSGAADVDDHSTDDDDGTTQKKNHQQKQKRSVFENSPEPDETTMEKYIRKEKERKQRRKEKMKAPTITADEHTSQGNEADEDQDLGFDDPFFAEADGTSDKKNASKLRKEERSKKRREREVEEAASAKQRAELELLMADDDHNEEDNFIKGGTDATEKKSRMVKHFDMNEIEKAEKAANKKHKNKKADKKSSAAIAAITTQGGGATVVDDFTINTTDPRFASLYENHEFAIDPTNPRFKGTKGMKALLEEGRKRKKNEDKDLVVTSAGGGSNSSSANNNNNNVVNRKNLVGKNSTKKSSGSGKVHQDENQEVIGLVEKIKRRSK